MANNEHSKVVENGREAIEQFRTNNPRVVFALGGAKLSGAKLSDANLSGADLSSANLSDADLNGAQLNRANMVDANLSGTILIGANLIRTILVNAKLNGANLKCADLSSADLSGADLSSADLSFADLSDANLSGANLCGVNLCRSNLSGANLCSAVLRDATVGYSVFGDVDLSEVKGLESMEHAGPSTIGIDTLFRSNGKIPDVFLRRCGLPEDFITYVPSFVGSAFDFYSCFISYSHKDKQFARQLHDRLQGKGIRCWLDEKELNPGDDLYHGIDRGVRVWDKVLLCSSKYSLTSWWCDNEIKIALDKERELQKTTGKKLLKIIPLNLDGFLFSDDWQSGYRQQVRDRVAADFTNWRKDADKFDRQLEQVVKALRTDGGKLPEPKPKLQ